MKGFTLIELMIAIAIIGCLSAIASPKLGSMIRKSTEATTKANLAIMRSALTCYYANHEGVYPTDDLSSLVTEGFLNKIPLKQTPPYHASGNVVGVGLAGQQGASTGDWYYVNVITDRFFGKLFVNCNHLTLTGETWDTL